MGTERYILPILEYVNTTLLDNQNILQKEKLIARDSQINNLTFKSVKKIFPSNSNFCILLDDRVDVWEEKDLLIKIEAYYYYHDKHLPNNVLSEKNDFFLEIITNIFTYVHSAFYLYYEKFNTTTSVKYVLKEKFGSIFHNKTFYIFDVKNEVTNDLYWIIDLFGGKVSNRIENDLDNDYICLLGDWRSKNKLMMAKENGENIIKNNVVISYFYVFYCFKFFYPLEYYDFEFIREDKLEVIEVVKEIKLNEDNITDNKEFVDMSYKNYDGLELKNNNNNNKDEKKIIYENNDNSKDDNINNNINSSDTSLLKVKRKASTSSKKSQKISDELTKSLNIEEESIKNKNDINSNNFNNNDKINNNNLSSNKKLNNKTKKIYKNNLRIEAYNKTLTSFYKEHKTRIEYFYKKLNEDINNKATEIVLNKIDKLTNKM